MDPVGASLSSDVQNQTHRQSILGSFLRVRPRGTSQSHQGPPNLQLENDIHTPVDTANMPAQPPSPSPGHRRRPATNGLQPSVSAAHSQNAPAATPTSVTVHGLSQMLRRRRSANGALNSSSANPSVGANSPVDGAPPTTIVARATITLNPCARAHRIRLVPHLDSNRSLHFEPISRDVREGDSALRIGRFTDRSGMGVAALNAQHTNKLAFKSKVVSRAHAEVWCEPGGKFFIKDTKSSSGTFLNHIRLSAPNTDSRPFPIKDGDVLQLGVDYQGGTEEIYKCVKMRIELGREWQAQANAFNTNALKQLKALSVQPSSDRPASKGAIAKSGISDCCICLFSVTVHQSLFIAPCSHVFHYKCIRPMLSMHHPGFSCPLCRTFANLDEDVEIDLEEVETDNADGTGTGSSGADVPKTARAKIAAAHGSMDVDDPVPAANTILSAASEAAQMNAAGAETEVERDFAPTVTRRNGDGGATLRNHRQSQSPARVGQFEDVPEDEDEYVLGETEDEGDEVDELHPLPALPVPVPSGPLPVPATSTSSSAPSQMQSHAIQPQLELDWDHFDMVNYQDVGFSRTEGEGDASGSSGEGSVGILGGMGEKRKK